MLRPVLSKRPRPPRQPGRFAIVASRYNSEFVDPMLRAARHALRQNGVRDIRIVRVPGAYEIPVVAARLARQAAEAGSTDAPTLDAIVCLGVILRGETTHAAHIGEAVSSALMGIQLEYLIPVIHEVLLLENREQAKVRCLGTRHNRGIEAAQTALAMGKTMRQLR